jgi:hypothetical protein
MKVEKATARKPRLTFGHGINGMDIHLDLVEIYHIINIASLLKEDDNHRLSQCEKMIKNLGQNLAVILNLQNEESASIFSPHPEWAGADHDIDERGY